MAATIPARHDLYFDDTTLCADTDLHEATVRVDGQLACAVCGAPVGERDE